MPKAAKKKRATKKLTAKTEEAAASLEVEEYIPDLERCQQGRWKTHPERQGAEFKIASTSQNPAWDAAQFECARQIDEACKDLDIDPTSEEAQPIQRKFVAKAIAKALLLDWRGVTKGGEPMKATLRNREWFCEKVRWVTNWILQEAGRRANYRQQAMEQDSGN